MSTPGMDDRTAPSAAPPQPPWPGAPVAWSPPDPQQRYTQQIQPGRRRGRRALSGLGILMMATALVGILGILGAAGLRAWSTDQLLDRIEQSEATMIGAQQEVGGLVAADEDLTGPQSAALLTEVERIAGETNAEVQALAQQIADVRIAPWDASTEQARQSYLRHSEAWQELLSATAGDGAQWIEPYPAIDRTWNVFLEDLQAAVPDPDVFGVQDRADAISGEQPDVGTLDL